MRNVLLLLLALMGSIGTFAATKSKATPSGVPDFAFPQTVVGNASAMLKKSMAERNYIGVLESCMQLTVAENMVDRANVGRSIHRMDSLALLMPSEYGALARLLEAQIYADYYSTNAGIFNGRTLPLNVYPENVADWSRALFAKKVVSLVEESIKLLGQSDGPELQALAPLLTSTDISNFIPDESDFIVYKGIDLLKNFSSASGGTIPFRVTSADSGMQSRPSQLASTLIDSLIDSRLDRYSGGAKLDPLAYAMTQRTQILSGENRVRWIQDCISRLEGKPQSIMLINQLAAFTSPGDYLHTDSLDMEAVKKATGFYELASDALKRWPDAYGSGRLSNTLASLTAPEVRVSSLSQFAPTVPVKVSMRLFNTRQTNLLVLSVPDVAEYRGKTVSQLVSSGKVVKSVALSTGMNIPGRLDTVVDLGVLPCGLYVTVPSSTSDVKGIPKNVTDKRPTAFRVSGMQVITVGVNGNDQKRKIYVVDAVSGAPLEGVKVEFRTMEKGVLKTKATAVTGEAGDVDAARGSWGLKLTRGNDVQYYNAYLYTTEESKSVKRIAAEVFTDLSVYHPGDSVSCVAVCYIVDGHDMEVAPQTKVSINLRDANNAVVASHTGETDSHGRVPADFVLPLSGLLGTWSMEVVCSGTYVGNGYFEVADYKTPAFFAEIDSVSPVAHAGDMVTISGHARTYSGMPVADAEVRYDIRYASWWCWRGTQSPDATFAGTASTDADGCFKIQLDTRMLKDTPYAFGAYRLNVSVTSPAGETQQAPTATFALGSAYNVLPALPSIVNASEAPSTVSVRVTDILGFPAARNIDYVITNYKGEKILSGSFMAPEMHIDFAKLSSGKYEAKFQVTGADTTASASADFIVWRSSDRMPPVETHLWTPLKKITAKSGEHHIDVPVGSSYKDSHVLCYLTDTKGFVKSEWLVVDRRTSSVKVEVPEKGNRLWLTLATVADLKNYQAQIEILPSGSEDKLEIITETFRDRLVPGDKETWRFRFQYNGSPQSFLPVMAVMSDKAINAIAPFRWIFSPDSKGWYNPLSLEMAYRGNISNSFALSSIRHSSDKVLILPGWQTYGYSLVPYNYMTRHLRIRGGAMPEAVVMAENVVNEVKETSSQAVMMKSSADFGAVKNQMAGGIDGVAESADDSESVRTEDIPLREMECPVAFFKPMLQTDSEGVQTLEFTVPDFNTTWQLQLLGYTRDLQSAVTTLEATAAKPVMVSVNMPRFLRTGDRASITSTLYNATDSITDIWGKIEIVDPMTGDVLMSRVSDSSSVFPSGSRVMTVDFAVPDSIGYLLIRAYAGSAAHTDGEQGLITVLPSSTPVTESTAFYLNPSEREFTMKLPSFADDASVTLQYCDNPIWYCVTALPSVVVPKSKNLLSLLRAYYGDATAKGIVNKYPAVAEEIRRLAASDPQSALSTNADLKTVELINTPWLNDASSETLRMRGLSTLLENIDPTISRLQKEIIALQNSDGGWSWCPGMQSSEYMTSNVLLHFGMLRKNGWLPSSGDIGPAIERGRKYLDNAVLESYRASKNRISVSRAVEWLYIRGFFGKKKMSAGVAALQAKALSVVRKEWRNLTIPARAQAAIVLNREGYASEASRVLESLRQNAVYTPSLGMRYENLPFGYGGYSSLFATAQVLEAFSDITPASSSVDRLRQGLIIKREVENWGAEPYTVDVIQAILGSGTDWTSPSDTPSITIGGMPVALPSDESPVGYCRVTLPLAEASARELKIIRTGVGPAWGSVMSQHVAPIDDVKESYMPEISVSKALYLVTDGGVSPVADAKALRVGDKVRVTLTLNTSRDMDYVAVTDSRSACLEPTVQLSDYTFVDGLWLYREVRDETTNFFIGFLPKGSHVITYDCYVDRQGTYSLGIATVQSQYAPQIVAHSAGTEIRVSAKK